MSAPNPRPYAKAARDLCPESDEHHAKTWFCTTCRMLESRLTPLHEIPGMAEALADADVSITVDWRADVCCTIHAGDCL